MTAAELYECDPGFRGFLAVWERDRRCPLELVDYLIERDMESQAECARWCATQPNRSPYNPPDAEPCGPCPLKNGQRDDYYYFISRYEIEWANSIPAEMVTELPKWFRDREETSPAHASVTLMDKWIKV